MANGDFDASLVRYGCKEVKAIEAPQKTIVEQFEIWVSNYKQLCHQLW